MESNLLINHPASLDTVTALKRDSDACISTSAHQSASACGSTEALCTIYQYIRQCRTVCGFDLPETRTMCTSVDQAVHICKLDWMLGRKPESNYSRDDIRSIQIPRAFQPPVHCAPFRLFGFGCDCKLARTYNYIPSLLPLPDSQGSTQLCPGTDFWLCRQIFRTWLDFPTSP